MEDYKDKDPNKFPEKNQPEQEKVEFPHENEFSKPAEGNDTSYSEKNDVTPPNKKEFPSVGPAETDFVSRPNGRTTGRMVGHEPGTENNL
jgi:hypothetical protein